MEGKRVKLFFSVGEPSGDLHAANLIRSLNRLAALEYVGFGGPRMAQAGCRLVADLTELAVMGVVQVIANFGRFLRLYRQAVDALHRERPSAVVLIDYPGFNWWVARAAKRMGIPVIYYGVPQMWAWGSWRVAKMRRLVDHVLCKLPFEADWYQARGCHATYVGHPYFDELHAQRLDWDFIGRVGGDHRPLVTILPGSRRQEIRFNMPWFVRAADRLAQRLPGVRFAVASLNAVQAQLAQQYASRSKTPMEVCWGRTPELIRAADCCWACSGSVSLELLFHEKPSVILYWVPALQYYLVRYLLIRVPFITLVNLLAFPDVFQRPIKPFDPREPGADEVPFPEYPTCRDRSEELASHAYQWLTNSALRARKIQQLAALKAQVAVPGASHRAAQYILKVVCSRECPSTALDAA